MTKYMAQKIRSIQEYIGKEFGKWTLLEDYGMIEKKRMVRVKCICGYEKNINFQEIKRGKSTNCGCKSKTRLEDYIGKKVHRLTILEKIEVKEGKSRVKVRCECGNEFVTRYETIMGGLSKSCGCLNKESVTTHGLSKHPLFRIWNGMKQRCSNPNFKGYKHYGGRGVRVSMRWENDFEAFYNWAIKRWKPGLDLDKDILASGKNGILYCPELCCFVTRKQNANNKGNSIKILFNGKALTASEWSEELNMSSTLISHRIRAGWSIHDALMKPLDKRYSKIYRNDYKQ
jgi:hypothetical protein